MLLDKLIRESQEYGADYIFGTGAVVTCREYRRIFRSLGYDLEIAMNYPWKQYKIYDFVRSFPMYAKFK